MAIKIINIVFILSVLFSTTGLALAKHDCAFAGEGDSCVCTAGGCQKGCCDTEWEYFEADLEKQLPKFMEKLPPLQAQAMVCPIWEQFDMPTIGFSTKGNLTYKPPIVPQDISVLYQVFRC